jgi:hypothetical protein
MIGLHPLNDTLDLVVDAVLLLLDCGRVVGKQRFDLAVVAAIGDE